MAKLEYQYDWQLARALFIGGMMPSDISKLPVMNGVSIQAINKRRGKENWDDLKTKAIEQTAGAIGRDLQNVRQNAIIIHQDFMVERLGHERRILKLHSTDQGGKHQRERLDNLRIIDELSRKALDMDKQAPQSPKQKNLAILLQMKRGGPVTKVLVNETEATEGQAGATTIAIAPYDNPNRDAEAEAREIIEEMQRQKEAPAPPRFKIKEATPSAPIRPLVNETQEIVEICQEAYPTARVEVISEGTQPQDNPPEGQ